MLHKQKNGFAVIPLIVGVIILLLLFLGGKFFLVKTKQNQPGENPFVKEAVLPGQTQEKFVPGNNSSEEQITIYANSKIGKANSMIGFVIGITYEPLKYNYDKTIELISALKPHFWRLSNHTNDVYGFIEEGDFVNKYNTELMFVVQDTIHVKYGYDIKISPECPSNKSNCFKTFDDFKSAWTNISTAVMKEMVQKNYPVKYFEIFGEPINVGFGKLNVGTGLTGITPEQLLELYKASHNIIRSAITPAKIGGPGWISYSKPILTAFLDYIVKEKLSLDFLSWHEFGAPEDVVSHVAEARNLINARPELCTVKCPEIAITEFSPDNNMHIPSTGLAWFYYLEKANVDFVGRACWGVNVLDGKPADICWETIDGMLMQDNVTTTDIYWVYKFYADMDHMRVRTDITKSNTVAISDRDDTQKELKVMVGRYGYKGVEGDVSIAVENYPYGSEKVSVEIWKIPANGTLYRQTALANPIRIESQQLSVINGEITLSIGSFKDGEVYYLVFRPI